jgi:hypothetical protein
VPSNAPDDSDDVADTECVKAALRRLVRTDSQAVIARAEASVKDLEAAREFVETVGLDELEAAVETTDDPARRERGRRALAAFQRFRRAAAGELDAGDHFHRDRGTDLRHHTQPSHQ